MATKKKPPTETGQPENTNPKEASNTADDAKAAAKPPKDENNGVSRPSSGATLKVWEIADALSAKHERPATRAEVTEEGLKADLVVGTIHTQYGRWRKYNGLVTPKEERQAKAAEAKAAKEKEKADKAAAKKAADDAKAAAKGDEKPSE